MSTDTYWDMATLIKETKWSYKKAKRKLIDNEVIWAEIEPFSHKPQYKNDEYSFVGSKMKEYLINNFYRLKEME
ncbi:DUF771 domain-containing protein [Staphylococcus xylosus]